MIANLARIISKGYVNDAAVMPANDPATNRRTGGSGLKYNTYGQINLINNCC